MGLEKYGRAATGMYSPLLAILAFTGIVITFTALQSSSGTQAKSALPSQSHGNNSQTGKGIPINQDYAASTKVQINGQFIDTPLHGHTHKRMYSMDGLTTVDVTSGRTGSANSSSLYINVSAITESHDINSTQRKDSMQ